MPKLEVSRSSVIDRPRLDVFSYVRDFKNWPTWSPWLISDPDCQVTFAEDGRSYSWEGKVCGAGSMRVEQEKEGESMDCVLEMLKPWKSSSKVRLKFQDQGEAAEVTWTMQGSLPFFLFFMKAMMEGFIGLDYERGLKMLKDQLETGNIPSALTFHGVKKVAGFRYLGLRRTCPMDELGEVMDVDFKKLAAMDLEPTGVPFGQYHKWDFKNRQVEYTLGYPTDLTSYEDLVYGEIPDGEVFQVEHRGNYRHLGNAWSAGIAHAQAKVFSQNKKIHPFELYITSPHEVSDDEAEVLVCLPVK